MTASTPPGISDEVNNERGRVYVKSTAQLESYTTALLPKQQRTPCSLTPVYRVCEPVPYTWVPRPDNPRIDDNGKKVKYEWPAGLPLCLDVLPRYKDALQDTNIPVWFTEGSKKADALTTAYGNQIIPVSLNGVWGWMQKTKDGASIPNPDLDAFAWHGRAVVLAFDSDVVRKLEVQQALKALARVLVDKGATVKVLILPEDDTKVGVDDALSQGMTPDEMLGYIHELSQLSQLSQLSPRTRLMHADELDSLPAVEMLPGTELQVGGFNVAYGPSGVGKSFYAIDRALTVAQEHNVVYVAAEGSAGYKARKNAWRKHHGMPTGGLYFYLDAVPMLDPSAVDAFIDQITPTEPKLVVLDTLARCMLGGDENSAKDMGLFIEACGRIQRATGAAVLVIHHTGKNGSNERGSSALRGAADVMVELSNEDGTIVLQCSKVKDSEPFAPQYYTLLQTDGSCVIVPADSVIVTKHAPLTLSQRKILETLDLDVFANTGAKALQLSRATNVPESSVWRTLSNLKKKGYITQSDKGDPYYITESGRSKLHFADTITQETRNSPELSQLSPNSHPTIDSSTLNYHNSHNPVGVRVSDSSLEVGNDSTVPIEHIPQESQRQKPTPKGAQLAFVNKLLVAAEKGDRACLDEARTTMAANPGIDWSYQNRRAIDAESRFTAVGGA
jgi:hypothetical protein